MRHDDMNTQPGRLLTEQEIRDFRAEWPKGGAMSHTPMMPFEEVRHLREVNADLVAKLKATEQMLEKFRDELALDHDACLHEPCTGCDLLRKAEGA